MRIGTLALLSLTWIGLSGAQTPTGSIAGIVCDPSGGGVPGARVQIVNESTGLDRQATTSGQGGYAFAALPPGEYEVSVETNGFEPMSRSAVVEAGTTTTTDFKLTIRGVPRQRRISG